MPTSTLPRDLVCSGVFFSEIVDAHFTDNPKPEMEIRLTDGKMVKVVGQKIMPTEIMQGIKTVFLIEPLVGTAGPKKILAEAPGAFSTAVRELITKETIFYTEPWVWSCQTKLKWTVVTL